MARVDLQCGCGHMFFVGDAQLKQPGGVKCPACLQPVRAPAGAASAAKPGSPKAPPPAAKDEIEEDAGFDDAPSPVAPSRTKLYVIGGVVGTVVLGAIVTLVIVLMSPGVDYEKQARLAEEARKRQFEEISSKGSKPSGPMGATPAAPTPAEPAKPPRSTEYKPMPAPPKPAVIPPAPAPTNPQVAPTPPKTPAAGSAMNAELLGRLRSEVLVLHPFYLSLVLTPAEKSRLDGLSSSGRGGAEDGDFLLSVLTGGKLKAVRDEVALIGQTLPTLERESQENLPVDRVTLVESGRVMNCKILDEGAEVVKVSRIMASGVGGQLPIRRDAISKIEKGKGIGSDFAARWESAQKGTLAGQVELLSWCKDNTLPGQAKLVAFTILRADPSVTLARTESGLPTDPVKYAEELAKGGMIAYQGKNWSPKQLKDKFISDGFVLLDGKWYSKKEKMIVVPGLFRYERQADKPVNFSGSALLCHESETTYKQVQDVTTGQYVEQAETKLLRRFYSPQMTVGLTARVPPGVVAPVSTYELDIRLEIDEPTPAANTKMTGEVIISVPVGAAMLDASVITAAEVKSGGSIVVYLVTGLGTGENERRTKLYTCDPKENQSHVIPTELIRGATDLTLVAVIEQTAAYNPKTERRHVRGATFKGKVQQSPAVDVIHYRQIPDYKALLFPSNSNTIEVFRLKTAVADPSPQLDKLFASNPDALR